MKAVFLFFSLLGDVIIFLAGLAVLALVIKIVAGIFNFVAVNFKSILIACFIIYVFLLYSLNCNPHKISFFYDLLTICSKQSNS